MRDTARDFWATRPRRPRRGRKIAGVAAGIGQRYAIDPVVVRVGFAVATLYGGVGIVLYLLGWLLLPDERDEVSGVEGVLGRGRSGMSALFVLALGALLIPATWFLFSPGFLPVNGLLSLLVALGVLYLLHRGRGRLASPATSTAGAGLGGPAAAADGPTATPTADHLAQPGESWNNTDHLAQPGESQKNTDHLAQPGESQNNTSAGDAATVPVPSSPPAWDPLGAAPFAWDLPDPTPQPTEQPAEPEPARRSRVGLFTLGATLVVAGALASVGPLLGGWLSPEHGIGVLLAVLGLGMVGGAFLRGGRGLIWLAGPLAVAGLALAHSSDGDGDVDRWKWVGDVQAAPTTVDSVDRLYERSVGSIHLDLRQLPDVGDVHTRAVTDVGDVEVWVPKNADVEVTCTSEIGEVICLTSGRSGADASTRVRDDGPDGPGGLKIVLEARASTGIVEVRRAN